MKIVLSRKGFDSAAGGVASPILPDGRMVSLPIPDRSSPIRYSDITLAGHQLGQVVESLTRGKKKAHFGAHLDPDLVADAYPRTEGWRPIFGQAGGEQSVLEREGVGPGDLFLFFGWFRGVEIHHGSEMRYRRGAEDEHVLWGWMQVGEVLSVGVAPLPAWASYHPHVAAAAGRSNNALYVASDQLTLGGVDVDLPGAGTFPAYAPELRLTKAGAKRSLWDLPAWFEPVDRPPLGYHANPSRWTRRGDRVELQTVGRGQEFVFDSRFYPEALAWIRDLLLR